MTCKKYRVWVFTGRNSILSVYFLYIILFCNVTSFAEVTFKDVSGDYVASIDERGNIQLIGERYESAGAGLYDNDISKKAWRIYGNYDPESASFTWDLIAIIPFENTSVYLGDPLYVNATPLVPGDMAIKGSFSTAMVPSIANSIFKLNDGLVTNSHNYFVLNSSGNVILLAEYDGQPVDEKFSELQNISIPIKQASIISPVFDYNPDDLPYVFNQCVDDVAYNYLHTYNPTATGANYRFSNSVACNGDYNPITWAKNDASGNAVMYMTGGDGFGMSFRTFVDEYSSGMGLMNYDTYGYPNSAKYCPSCVISKFTRTPGQSISQMNALNDIEGQTIARFLDPIEIRVPTLDDIESSTDFTNLHTYFTSNQHDLQPMGMLYVKDPNTNNKDTLFMSVNGLNDTKRGLYYDSAFILLSYDDTNTPGVDEMGTKWEPHTNISDHGLIGQIDPVKNESCVWGDPNDDVTPEDDGIRFCAPVFIQFGMGYEDYAYSGLDPGVWEGTDPAHEDPGYYIYAVSPSRTVWDRSELYLGRVFVSSGNPEDVWNDYDAQTESWVCNWEYWAGTDFSGDQIWVPDENDAQEIMYSEGEVGLPSIMYHKPSGRYLMTTFTISDKGTFTGRCQYDEDWGQEGFQYEPIGGRNDHRWFLWEAPKPWGPWRKIMTDDYHGAQSDVSGLNGLDQWIDGKEYYSDKCYGYVGYTVQLVPSWGTTYASDGGWDIWTMQTGFFNFWRKAGGILYPHWDKYDWGDEGGYTSYFVKVHLSPNDGFLTGKASAMNNYQQNTFRRDVDTDGSIDLSVGVLIKPEKDITVTHLGRYYDTGNDDEHTLNIYQVVFDGDQAIQIGDDPVASVTVDMDPAQAWRPMDEHGFVYGVLSSPVSLSHNNYYVLVSTENPANDTFFGKYDDNAPKDYNTTSLTELRGGHAVKFIKGAEKGTQGNVWTLYKRTKEAL